MKDNYVSIPVILGAAVAAAATFTVSYPDGYNAGDFSDAHGHYLSLNGTKLQQPQHILLTFNAGNVTVTNNTGDTLPANQKGFLQLEIMGEAAPIKTNAPNGSRQSVHNIYNGEYIIDFGSPIAANTSGIMAAAAVGAVALTFGVSNFLGSTPGVLDVPRNIRAQGDGAGANQVITFSGFDEYEQPMSETLTLNSNTVIEGAKAFKRLTVISVAAGGNAAHTVNVGWGDVLGIPFRIKDEMQVTAEQIANVIVRRDLVRLNFQHTEAELDAAAVRYLAPGFAGKVIDAGITLDDVVTTGGAITYAVGATTITGLTNTIADGATAGTFYQDTPTNDGTEYFLATDYLKVTPAGAINASAPANEWLTVLKTNGRFTPALVRNTKTTANNGDVRGTWKPNTPTDGTTSFALHVKTSEASNIGNYQFTA